MRGPRASAGRPSVALVVPGLEEGGGVPAVAQFLHEVLRSDGRFEPHIVSLATRSNDGASLRIVDPGSWLRGPMITEGTWRGLPFRHSGCRFAELEFQRYAPRDVLTRLLDRFSIVQVVAGSPAWALAARRCTRPVLLQVATLVAEERKAQFRRRRDPWRRLMTRITARRDLVGLASVRLAFVENQWMQRTATALLGPSRVVLAPPGIDTAIFRPGDAYRAEGPLLSVGRFADPRKNVRLLIEAYAGLRAAEPRAPRLVLAGESGPPKDELRLARDLGVEEFLEVRLAPSREELAALYREASLFVLSSDEEGLGIVILEAMASGLPVLATRCGGPEVSVIEGENGLLVPVQDASAMTMGLLGLLSDPDRRRRMGEDGRRKAENLFSLRAAGRHFLDAYARILSEQAHDDRAAAPGLAGGA